MLLFWAVPKPGQQLSHFCVLFRSCLEARPPPLPAMNVMKQHLRTYDNFESDDQDTIVNGSTQSITLRVVCTKFPQIMSALHLGTKSCAEITEFGDCRLYQQLQDEKNMQYATWARSICPLLRVHPQPASDVSPEVPLGRQLNSSQFTHPKDTL